MAIHGGEHRSGVTRHGLVLRDNVTTDRVQEAASNNRLIQQHWDLIKEYRPKPEVGLLFDQDNALLTFALAGNEKTSTSSFTGYHRALWNMDLWVEFIEPASLSTTKCKVLIVPWHLIGKRETCTALRQYVEAGGTLILEAAFGLFDERFYYNDVIPPHGLRDIFGYREKQNSLVRAEAPTDAISESERIYYQPDITFTSPVEVRVRANTFLTPLEVTSATTIATYEDMPVAVRKNVGKGQLFYFGTNLGGSLAAGDAGAIRLLRSIVTSIVKPEVTATAIRPRLVRGAGHTLLTVFNDTPKEQSDRILLPAGFSKATDIHSGKEISLEQHSLQIAVPYQDVVVLRLT